MRRRTIYSIFAVLIILFSLIAFIPPFDKNLIFGIAYVFGIVTALFQMFVWSRLSVYTADMKNAFLRIPAVCVGTILLIVQLIASIVFMAVPNMPLWVVVLLQSIVFISMCIVTISGFSASAVIQKTEEKVQAKSAHINSIKAEMDVLISQERDPAIKEELISLADIIRYSDPMSNSSLESIENQIIEKILALSSNVDNKPERIAEIKVLLEQRNKKCKQFK